MANLKEIRNRINSISSTMQITSAMKMVSAAKSKKAQEAIHAMKPYANTLGNLLKSLKSALGTTNPFLPREKGEKRILVVAITSDRGLCGAFNSTIVKHTLSLLEKYEGKEVEILTIGKKGNDILKKTGKVSRYCEGFFDHMDFQKVATLAQELMDAYTKGTYDRIILVYNSFKNVATQILTEEVFLPLQLTTEDEQEESDFIYEPSAEAIIEGLIPKHLKLQLYKALRDSLAAEHGARMTAMHKATDNASTLRDELTLTYNKARQTAITNEILEIVSGANALNN
ncbi:ATP synthase F1 subunit gamma [Capnocytophaga granulosa]|uniref:ATP synthase F1 subunit gamma n=1 Tax=Capnocytophaga granulosa TaxID=45242 RepID=UPI003857B7C3